MFESLKEDIKEKREEGTLGDYEYTPDDDDRERRFEYKVEDIAMNNTRPGDFLNKHTENGWRLIRTVEGEDLGVMGPGSSFSMFFIFERPVDRPEE